MSGESLITTLDAALKQAWVPPFSKEGWSLLESQHELDRAAIRVRVLSVDGGKVLWLPLSYLAGAHGLRDSHVGFAQSVLQRLFGDEAVAVEWRE